MAQSQTVTVLFCDTVGSTALMVRLGDEANDRVRRQVFAALREAIAAYRGEEVKTAGDGIMVAFPASAADAVSCAVAMQRAVSRLDARDPLLGLSVRIGISSGEATHEDNDWFGTPVVEAARLEGKAHAGQILAADVIRVLVGNRGGHTFTAAGELELKGLPEPLNAVEVAWEPDPGLLAIPLPSGLTRSGLPFVGRESALATLREMWDRALAGTGGFVAVSGEDGIGKTRLAAEFAASVHSDAVTVLYGRSDMDREVAFQPFADALRWYVLSAQPQALRDELADSGGEIARLVPALRTKLPETPEPRPGDPESERNWLFNAVAEMLRRASERSPFLLVLDDLEQANAETLALLRHVLHRVESMRLLVVGLVGPTAAGSAWGAEGAAIASMPGARSLPLEGLSALEVAALVERAVGTTIAPEVAERVRGETGGNPRWVSEFVSRMAESRGTSGPAQSPEAILATSSPYMGLRHFDSDDASLFFGREEVTGALLGRLSAARMLTVVGASGSGKSSLVRAGLVPQLRDGALPGSRDWQVVVMTPGANPLAELAAKLAAPSGLTATAILRDLEADSRALDLTVRQALDGRPDNARLLLVVDQFEEVYTLCREAEERQRFFDALLHAVAAPGGRTMAIIAMRADFYGETAKYPGLAAALEASHALLGPMTNDDLRAAIEQPAAATGLQIAPGLVERILADVGDEPGGLPLLSHALLETWKRREGRVLTMAGYEASGGVRGAIAQTADSVYSDLSAAEQGIARDLFLRLTEFGEGTEDTRRRVAFSEVAPEGPAGEQSREVINRLADARLLTTSENSVEVAHEALIREWPRLRGWLDDDREGLRVMRHLTESSQSWENLARDEGELYRGTRLAAATEWVERAQPTLNPLESEFLGASRELHEREEREAHARVRRLRILAAAASALAVVALIVGGLAVWQWAQANDAKDEAQAATGEAEVQRDAAEAARQQADKAVIEATLSRLETEIPLLVTTDRSLAFGLAAAAHQLQPGPRTDAIMNVVLGDDPRYLGRIFPSEPRLSGYDLSPDGKYIALRTTGGLLELYDATTRELVTSIQAEPTGAFAIVSFLPDGKSILSATFDQTTKRLTLTLRDVPDLAELQRFELSSVQSMAGRLQADGRQFLMTINGVLHIFDITDWMDRTVPGLQPVYGAPHLDPLGRYMAAALGPSPQATNAVGLFDARTFELVRSVPAAPSFFAFTPDGTLLVMSFGSAATNLVGRADHWDPETGELIATIPTAIDPGAIAIDSAGEHAALKTATRQLGIVALPELEQVAAPFETLSQVASIPKFGEGDDRLYFHALTYALEHWDLSGSGLASVYTEAAGPGNVALAPDGSWFVKQSADGHWSRWRVPGFALIDRSTATAGDAVLTGAVDTQPGPAVSGDGKYFATAHSDCPRPSPVACAGSVVFWDAATGTQVGEPVRVPAQAVQNWMLLEFHPDLPLLAIAFQNLVTVVSLEDGLPSVAGSFTVENPNGPYIAVLDFLPSAVAQSPTLVVRATQLLSVWDVAEITGAPLGTWNHQATVRGMAVAPDGTVALMRTSGDLQFVDHESLVAGTEPEPLSVVPGVVPPGQGAFLRFSADGRTVAFRNNTAGTVSVWDVETKTSIGASFATAGTTSAHLLPDGKSLLVASDQLTIHWNLDTALWPEKVCFAAGRNLTESEWADFFPGRDYEVTCPQWPARPPD